MYVDMSVDIYIYTILIKKKTCLTLGPHFLTHMLMFTHIGEYKYVCMSVKYIAIKTYSIA